MKEPSTLTKNITEWLKKTGFPLEMEAAAAFREAGFDVRQSATFADPQADKGREIDVLAQDPDWVGIVDISFVVECKSAQKPWLIFISDDALKHVNRINSFGVKSGVAREVLAKRISKGIRRELPLLSAYIERPDRGGYGFRQAMGGENDQAFSAAIAALKACHGLAQDSGEGQIARLAFAFPIIVVDSPLFECERNPEGELVLKEVQKSEFLFSAHIPNHVGCCIKVVRREYLNEAARESKELADALRNNLASDESEILAGAL
ncbi:MULTISPECIES: hypothetical protein [Pseudomonas]|uniref:hypothetical protein n=1 Tax=Pseudomonas TaxID=286 RepID=UPI000CF655C0|nr:MULTISPECIES: hypothetical protein [Pseudomonas]AVJ35947.1 hypothetical protein CLM75_00900 [Pseudomonas lurida]PRA13552.1 hypothetical protein CQ002_23505 [Pseudomonas sp. MYb13]PRA16888.1 hypothetical protein CQ004_25345 [Pseudomonas lurida]PRA29889.1 hypothetical protein CQ005_23580 [Pseudomonas lurida]PRB96133.1 hypothetical protein CQ014_24000 [Pseudomonas lurida]